MANKDSEKGQDFRRFGEYNAKRERRLCQNMSELVLYRF